MKHIHIILLIISVLLMTFNPGFTESMEEARGLWIVRHTMTSRNSIKEALDQAKQNNFNMVFVQIVGRGDAYYHSALLPRWSSVNNKPHKPFDPLEFAVDYGHKIGLQVHAWVNVYYVWSSHVEPNTSSHVYHSHPDWMMVDNYGKSISDYTFVERKNVDVEGSYISPGNPAVRQFIRKIVREIVENYEVDGIHLDYVRYPSPKFSFDRISRGRFEKKFKVDPLKLINGHFKISDEQYHYFLVKWKEWRANQVSRLVKGIYYDIQLRDSDIVLSAAVIADLDYAKTRFGQEWDEWLKEEIIDFVVPMAYSSDTQKVAGHLKVALANQYNRHVYAGLGAYNQDKYSVIEKIYKTRELGLKGYVLFSYDGVKDEPYYLYTLRKGPLKIDAEPPGFPWKKGSSKFGDNFNLETENQKLFIED